MIENKRYTFETSWSFPQTLLQRGISPTPLIKHFQQISFPMLHHKIVTNWENIVAGRGGARYKTVQYNTMRLNTVHSENKDPGIYQSHLRREQTFKN